MPLDFCPACGVVLKEKRSHRHHRFYFACIKAAYENWPEESRFLPENQDHLRHWLQIQAGHFDIVGQHLEEDDRDILKMADFATRVLTKAKETGSTGFIEVNSQRSMVVKFAKSINWSQVTQAQFQPIAQKVFDLIEAEIGVPVEQLVFETERAA